MGVQRTDTGYERSEEHWYFTLSPSVYFSLLIMCIYHLVETQNTFYWKDNIHWKKTSWEKSWRINTACPHKEPDCVGETGAQGGSVFWHTSLLPCAHFLCCSKRSNDTNEEIDTMTKATATAFLLWSEESHQLVEKECARGEQRGKRSSLSSQYVSTWEDPEK